ncbi:MAG: cysteine desulfurase [Candidatus Tagabacteria bacterium]
MIDFNADKIRKDFPILAGDKPPVYFDNACMTLKPEPVIKAVEEYYREYPACAGRSNHRLGELVNQKIKEARKIIAGFINASSEEIIFTRNTTEGINLIAKSFIFQKGEAILISDKEHNSNLAPWQILAKEKEIKLGIIKSKDDNTFDLEEFQRRLNPEVKLVSVVFVSNLDGVSNPIKEIVKISHQNNSLVLVDAAQAAGRQKIDIKDLNCDFLAFSGHKVLGPTGTGVLYVKKNLMEKLNPFIVGGGTLADSTYESHKFLEGPERFEAGLQDYAGIIGLGEAVKYLENIGFENIKSQEEKLNQIISEGIRNLSGIKIIGPENHKERGGIVNFYHQKMASHEIALLLDKTYDIMARSGRHCVHSWFNSRDIKDSVRASVYFYNTEAEAKYFIESLNKIIKLT